MNINPLLKQAITLSQNHDYSFVLKHMSKTTDMSQQLLTCIDTMVKKYRTRQLEVIVKLFDDGRVYVYFTRDINHPDDTIPMTKAKEAFLNEVKSSGLLAPN